MAVLGALKARCVVYAAVLRLRAGADRHARRARRGARAGHDAPSSTGARCRACATRLPRPATRDPRRRRAAAERSRRAPTGTALVETACGRLHHPADRSRGHGAAALHQRHDRPAQGRGPCARRGGGAHGHRPLRARPARRRRLLVHRRSRLGHRHQLRHHRAADATASPTSSSRPSSTPRPGTACWSASASASGTPRRPRSA